MSIPRPNRFALWALTLASGVALVGCRPAANDLNATSDEAEPPATEVPSLPLPAAPMDRAALLQEVARAASAAAAGIGDGAQQRELDGRQFEVRIRFGCRGPTANLPAASMGWSFDPETRTLRVRAVPTITRDDALVSRMATDAVEAVEGFWIGRPWLLDAVCPAAPPADEADAAAPPKSADVADDEAPETRAPGATRAPRIGLAEFHSATASRSERRSDRGYQAVKVLPDDQPVGSQGFDLVIAGRLQAMDRNRVIHCHASSPEAPPDCIISARFDRVRIETPQTQEIVAEWSRG